MQKEQGASNQEPTSDTQLNQRPYTSNVTTMKQNRTKAVPLIELESTDKKEQTEAQKTKVNAKLSNEVSGQQLILTSNSNDQDTQNNLLA